MTEHQRHKRAIPRRRKRLTPARRRRLFLATLNEPPWSRCVRYYGRPLTLAIVEQWVAAHLHFEQGLARYS